MRALRIIDTGLSSARWNTAASLALLECHELNRETDCLRFYSFHPSVLLGRGQTRATGVDSDYCERHNIDVARRVTGGGAVYMNPTMLVWDFVTDVALPHARLSDTIGNAIARGLGQIAISAHFCPPNDLTIDDRKISGAATTSLGRSFLHQGTLLLEDAREQMASTLGIPLSALHTHVTSLAEAGYAGDRSSLQDAIGAGLAECFHLTPENSTLTELESALTQRDLSGEIGFEPVHPIREPSTGTHR